VPGTSRGNIKILNFICLSSESRAKWHFSSGVRRVFQFRRQRTYQINLKFSRSRTLEQSTLFLLIDAHASVRRHVGKSGQKQFDYPLEHVMTPLENTLKTMPIFFITSRAAVALF